MVRHKTICGYLSKPPFMIGATQTNLSVLLRRCTIYTIELTSRASSLAFIGTVLAMVMVLLELCGVLRSKKQTPPRQTGPWVLFPHVQGLHPLRAVFLALKAVKVVAAVSALVFPPNKHLAELAEELAVMWTRCGKKNHHLNITKGPYGHG